MAREVASVKVAEMGLLVANFDLGVAHLFRLVNRTRPVATAEVLYRLAWPRYRMANYSRVE